MIDGSSAQCSLNCDCASTKSRVALVPERLGYRTCENMRCSAWPKSWNIVRVSSNVSSAGCPCVGFVKLAVLNTTGLLPRSADWGRYELAHAPPRLLSRLK